MSRNKYIAAVDVGTTSIRCLLFDFSGNVRSVTREPLIHLYPHHGWLELNPDDVWEKFKTVFLKALENVEGVPSDIATMGISTHRNSFTTWDKRNGKPFHNFITWKDLRANDLVKQLNSSWKLQAIKIGAKLLYMLTSQKRFYAGSAFSFMNGMLIPKLRWMLDQNEDLRKCAKEGFAALGTIDTYLIHKLSLGKIHATDYSNVCVTGMFDPYIFGWADWVMTLLDIPKSLLPEIKDSTGSWGVIHEDIFGCEIPIHCVVSDQGALLFGSFCFNERDVRLSMGTGAFLARSTGKNPIASVKGLYPIIGWKIGAETAFFAEGLANDSGCVLEWCRNIGLFETFESINGIVTSVSHSDDVYFVPAFAGIQAPVNDETATAGFLGLKPSTRKEHLLRAATESLAFRVSQLCRLMTEETGCPLDHIRVSGGVSQNDFLMQLISDLNSVTIDRQTSVELSAHGACYMAGLSAGIWKSRDEIVENNQVAMDFVPKLSRRIEYETKISTWEKAVGRLLHWH